MDPKLLRIGLSVNIQRSDGMWKVQVLMSCLFALVYICIKLTSFPFKFWTIFTSPPILGRIHPAAISGIDSGKECVSVEWYENDETKGKEVKAVTMGCIN